MQIDPRRLDEAVEAEGFTGMVTVDVGDQRVLERCEGFLNLDPPMGWLRTA
jgi:hypothetical protein